MKEQFVQILAAVAIGLIAGNIGGRIAAAIDDARDSWYGLGFWTCIPASVVVAGLLSYWIAT